jgi:protein-S-isoprenylcysteine O-methyltransferase Ste14
MVMPPPAGKRGVVRKVAMLAAPVLWIVMLFAGAGRLDWTRGWLCVALYVVGMSLIGLMVRRANPSVIEARAKWRKKGTKGFDKVFLGVLPALAFVQAGVAGVDAVRYGWSSLPAGLAYVGAVLLALAIGLIGWTLRVNRFAEASVRIQEDRGHTVVSSGPYQFVRHPMYAGAIAMYMATSFILGSVWALAISAVLAALYFWRTVLEDGTLRRELPGYEEYAAHTRYRLIPRVW